MDLAAGRPQTHSMQSTFGLDDVKGWSGQPLVRDSVRMPGYRGIWYTLGQRFPYGDKYSGGLGTYTACHQPMALYHAASHKTFFTYGGTPAVDRRELTIMVSYFDHATGQVPQPVVVYFDPAVDDAHDNASLQMDREGYLWVFKSGRGKTRPGLIFRSTKPASIDSFTLLDVREFTYPQVRLDDRGGFFMLCTQYTMQSDRGPARKLFWQTSADRRTWSDVSMLAGFEGHYQVSGQHGNKVATFFNWHPGSNVDRRTNLYYAQTTDWGKTWTGADGTPLAPPYTTHDNPALVIDYHAVGRCMYPSDLNFDALGNPILLYIISQKGEPGPPGGPREWTLLHWKNGKWNSRVLTTSDHNYDVGSILVSGKEWRVIGPTEPGPQEHGTGGEVGLWVSPDEGVTWTKEKVATRNSAFNHSYVRRSEGGLDPFAVFWADGNPEQISPSRIYFTDSKASAVRVLPYEMSGDWAVPEVLSAGD